MVYVLKKKTTKLIIIACNQSKVLNIKKFAQIITEICIYRVRKKNLCSFEP